MSDKELEDAVIGDLMSVETIEVNLDLSSSLNM